MIPQLTTSLQLFVMDFFLSQQTYPLIIAQLLSLILASYLFLYFKSKSPKGAPLAGGSWPIIGHLSLFAGGSQLLHIVLGTIADKYGPIFTVRLGIHRILVVSGWEIVKEISTTHDLATSSRPKFTAADHMSYDYAMFGFAPYGPFWRDMRKLISLELLSTRRLELLKHVRVSELKDSVNEIYKLWDENKKSGEDKVMVMVEMKNWFGNLNLNVVLRMVVGRRYFGATSAEDEEAAKRCRRVMREFFRLVGMNVPADAFPFLRWLDLGGYQKAMKENAKEMDSIMEGWLKEHHHRRDSGEVIEEQDFMDVMLSKVEKEGFYGFDANTLTKSTCMVLITGGVDTTTVELTWALSLLLNNRHALKKVQDELDLHIGKSRQVDESDLSKLTYLQAAVKEILRLYPAGQFGGIREFTEDCTVAGYHVPKGTRLMTNLWKMHRDPTIWPNPLEFMPERFLNSHKDVDVKGQHFELIPFGAGRRFCPGINLAIQMLHLVLATLLHNFDLSTPGDAPVDMTASAGMTNEKTTPLKVLLSPRLSRDMY